MGMLSATLIAVFFIPLLFVQIERMAARTRRLFAGASDLSAGERAS